MIHSTAQYVPVRYSTDSVRFRSVNSTGAPYVPMRYSHDSPIFRWPGRWLTLKESVLQGVSNDHAC